MHLLLNDILSGMGGGAGVIALLGLIIKLFPGAWHRFCVAVAAGVILSKLPSDSEIAKLVAQVSTEDEYHRKFDERMDEVQKDQIKPVIMQLIGLPGDHSKEVAYELDKLEELGADCWISLSVGNGQAVSWLSNPSVEENVNLIGYAGARGFAIGDFTTESSITWSAMWSGAFRLRSGVSLTITRLV
ncbi:MAG: hypothetical protein LKJ47_04765 [Bifidobacteriaceae bacterium]|nr:hypothetical protein [Bifidobacteriaceae bacterium]